jgi:CubicO group peptidase (beta-lactamase class C family)
MYDREAMAILRRLAILAVALFATAGGATLRLTAQARTSSALSADLRAAIDRAVTDTLEKTGAPSASIAIVRDGAIAYVRAYGSARLDPPLAATPAMRYSIGSISKQFTSTAILLLQEQGKLSIDDPVSRWLPDLTRARDVSIRQLLSMTSGYQDYWPQDYVMPPMLQPTTPQAILDTWAKKPLDFEPGTKWQYSNTNYVAAGVIAEKASGTPLLDQLRTRLFTPLGMTSVTDIDAAPLGPGEPSRYLRYAIGPLRPAPKEGRGWLFAAGELAMTARDLAAWDIATIKQTVLTPASYREMQTDMRLKNGLATGYGLGVSVGSASGRRRVSHGGEVSGFTAANDIYPDDGAAVVVLANLDATGAVGAISGRIGSLIFESVDAETAQATARAREIFDGLQRGRLDRALFSSNANAYFSDQAIADFAAALGPLGAPISFTQQAQGLRGGMVLRAYSIVFAQKRLRLTTFILPDGLLEQYQIAAVE